MTGPFKHPLAVGAKVHVRSDHFPEECTAVVREAAHEPNEYNHNHWAYRVEVVSGETPESARESNGEIWLCDFEVHPLT